MAAGNVFAFVVVAMVLVGSTMAKKFFVGGNKGWTTKYNYDAWALGNDFRVGDQLVFRYRKGEHNVFNVDGSTFQQCVPPPLNEALTTGNDVITLETPGQKWFICSIGNHCEDGKQKLHITVFPQSQSLSPESTTRPESGAPMSSATRILQFKHQVLIFIFISTVTINLLMCN